MDSIPTPEPTLTKDCSTTSKDPTMIKKCIPIIDPTLIKDCIPTLDPALNKDCIPSSDPTLIKDCIRTPGPVLIPTLKNKTQDPSNALKLKPKKAMLKRFLNQSKHFLYSHILFKAFRQH